MAFPKGVVDAPVAIDRLGWFLSDWAAAAGRRRRPGSASSAYLVYAWSRVGRDPRPGTVVPIFSPPDDLTPAAMRYIVEQKFDNRAFAAALVDAAVKGHVRLVEDDGGFFGGSERRIERLRHARCNAARRDRAGVAQRAGRPQRDAGHGAEKPCNIFRREQGAGEAVLRRPMTARCSFAIMAGSALRSRSSSAAFWLAAAAVVLGRRRRQPSCWSCCPRPGMAIGGLVFPRRAQGQTQPDAACCTSWRRLSGESAVVARPCRSFPDALTTGNWLPLAIPLIGLPFVISSFFWMSAPTKEGRGVLDRIAGFKQYLSITERERLDRMQAPEGQLQLFERFLPYAIALGVENRWADRYTACWPRPRRPRRCAGLWLVFRVVEPVERYRRVRQFDRHRRSPATVSSPRPLPARPVARAAADRRAAVAAEAAEAAGNQPFAGRRKKRDRLAL